jgi:hypothetical protein
MTGDSVSNFLDVTAAHRAAVSAPVEVDLNVSRRAQILAKLSEGVTSFEGLTQETELSDEAAASAVDWLSEQGLVQVHSMPTGARQIELPENIKEVLEQQ